MGVPVIGCQCKVCASDSPFNKRLRSSVLISVNDKTFLIDAGPDFREQALKYCIKHLDGVILTHAHFDHIGGLDDLRVFYFIKHKPLPCLLLQETFDELEIRYDYLMRPPQKGHSLSAQFDFHVIDKPFGAVNFEGLESKCLTYYQGGMKVLGVRLGNLAYVLDIKQFTEAVFTSLQGIDILILSALRYSPSEMHFSIDEAIAFARKVGAKKTYFTHISHDLEHHETSAKLPKGIALGYDGFELDFQC